MLLRRAVGINFYGAPTPLHRESRTLKNFIWLGTIHVYCVYSEDY
jgi:hypothetical protein